MRLIIAGGRDFTDADMMEARLYNILGGSVNIWPDVVISGMARGADTLGWEWAKAHGVEVIEMPADWARYGRSAGYRRNEEMARAATHLVAFWDGVSRGTSNMIGIARRDKLALRIVRY
jgi:hypothetical protein